MPKGVTYNKKVKLFSKEEIKKKLLDSMTIDEVVEFDDLNKEAEKTQDPEEAAKIVKRYEGIIKTKKKGITNVAFYQGQIFKRFKEKEKFAKLVSELEIRKTTTIFKIIVFKLCKKYAKLLKSSIGLGFLKIIIRALKQFARKMNKIFSVERLYLLKLSL